VANIRLSFALVVPEENLASAKRDTVDALARIAANCNGHVAPARDVDLWGPVPQEVGGQGPISCSTVSDIRADAAVNREIFDWEDLPDEL
jgi:hypothetical protein